eukprot:40645-Chlamydomonas_euryale.AAC.5
MRLARCLTAVRAIGGLHRGLNAARRGLRAALGRPQTALRAPVAGGATPPSPFLPFLPPLEVKESPLSCCAHALRGVQPRSSRPVHTRTPCGPDPPHPPLLASPHLPHCSHPLTLPTARTPSPSPLPAFRPPVGGTASTTAAAAAYVLFYRRRCDAAADPPGLVDELVAARAQADREAAAAAATAGPGAEAVALAESEQDANLLGVGAAVAAARTTRRRANSSSSTELSVLNDSDYLADGLGDMDSGDDSWPRPDRRGGSGGGTSAAVRPRKGKSGAAHAGTMRPRESDAPAWMLNFGNPVLRRSSSSRPVSAGGSGGGLHIAADTMEGIQRTGSGGGGSSGVGSPCGADADSTGAAVDIACGDNGDECGSRGGGRKDGDWVHLEMMSTSP